MRGEERAALGSRARQDPRNRCACASSSTRSSCPRRRPPWSRRASRAPIPRLPEIVLTAHLQEEKFSANDDQSGVANVLEIGRALTRLIADGKLPRPRRGIRFWWADEIYSEYRYFADHPGEEKKFLANLNQDMVGAKQSDGHRTQFMARTPWSQPSFLSDVQQSILDAVVDGQQRVPSGLAGADAAARLALLEADLLAPRDAGALPREGRPLLRLDRPPRVQRPLGRRARHLADQLARRVHPLLRGRSLADRSDAAEAQRLRRRGDGVVARQRGCEGRSVSRVLRGRARQPSAWRANLAAAAGLDPRRKGKRRRPPPGGRGPPRGRRRRSRPQPSSRRGRSGPTPAPRLPRASRPSAPREPPSPRGFRPVRPAKTPVLARLAARTPRFAVTTLDAWMALEKRVADKRVADKRAERERKEASRRRDATAKAGAKTDARPARRATPRNSRPHGHGRHGLDRRQDERRRDRPPRLRRGARRPAGGTTARRRRRWSRSICESRRRTA